MYTLRRTTHHFQTKKVVSVLDDLIKISKVKTIVAFVLCGLVIVFPIRRGPMPRLLFSRGIDVFEMVSLKDEKHDREQDRTKKDPESRDETRRVFVPEQVHGDHVASIDRDDVHGQCNGPFANRSGVSCNPSSLERF